MFIDILVLKEFQNMAEQYSKVSASGKWVNKRLNLVDELIMEDLEERMRRCDDASFMMTGTTQSQEM